MNLLTRLLRRSDPPAVQENRGKFGLTSTVRSRSPRSRPIWHGTLAQNPAILYPDDNLLSLMEEFRRTMPLFDRGINVLSELVGCPEIEGSAAVVKDLTHWMREVPVNQHQQGLDQWIRGHLDGMLIYGKGVGEVVPERGLGDVQALVNIDPRSVLFQMTADPLVLLPKQRQRHTHELLSLPRDLTVISVHGAHTDRPHGVSLFRSCPFIGRALRTVENSTVQNWQRLGSPPFHINAQLGDEVQDPQGTLAGEVLQDLKTAWDSVMGAGRDVDVAQVADYFTAGEVTVSVMGADGQVLEMAAPYRVFAEQVIAAIGLPPWMFGFHWSTAERLAAQQLEMAITRINGLRRAVEPQIRRVLELRQAFSGSRGDWELCWPKVSLADLESAAKAAMMDEQAQRQKVERIRILWELGYIDQQTASTLTDPTLGPVVRKMATPPMIDTAQAPGLPPGDSGEEA